MAEKGGLESTKVLSRIEEYLSDEQLEKLFFLSETVLSRTVVERADGIIAIQRELERLRDYNRNNSLKLLQRFLETIGYGAFARELEPLIDNSAPGHSCLPLQKLYLYEIIVMVCDNLGKKSLSQLKNRIPDSQLGAHRDRIKTSIQLFKKLIERQTLSVSHERKSLALLMEWLDDIGRRDIVQLIKDHPRPIQEQGLCYLYFCADSALILWLGLYNGTSYMHGAQQL